MGYYALAAAVMGGNLLATPYIAIYSIVAVRCIPFHSSRPVFRLAFSESLDQQFVNWWKVGP